VPRHPRSLRTEPPLRHHWLCEPNGLTTRQTLTVHPKCPFLRGQIWAEFFAVSTAPPCLQYPRDKRFLINYMPGSYDSTLQVPSR